MSFIVCDNCEHDILITEDEVIFFFTGEKEFTLYNTMKVEAINTLFNKLSLEQLQNLLKTL